MITALIIEDEAKVARELGTLMEAIRQDVNLLGTVGSIEEAVSWFQNHDQPDVIFSDIQLSDGLSFEIFKQVKTNSPIIFCTAFDEYMMNAFEANAIHYLLKPVGKIKLQEAFNKYEELKQSFDRGKEEYLRRMERLLNQTQTNYSTTLLVNFRERITPVKIDDIAYLYYSNGVVSIALLNNISYSIQETLDELETKLNPQTFFRANRQFIINRSSVKEIERYFSRKLVVKLSLKTPENIVISKIKAQTFLKWIEGN